MASLDDSSLGRTVTYPTQYDPSLLFPIGRAAARAELGLDPASPPFQGEDIWNAYELSWLNARGKPQVALARFIIPAASPCIVESKSFKLYLNSFNQTRLSGPQELRERLLADVGKAAGCPIEAELILPGQFSAQCLRELDSESLDGLDVDVTDYLPAPQWLSADAAAAPVHEVLASRLLKSNCPVTGQPDWACVRIEYRGAPIDRSGLLRYIVSFRNHSGFHEQCVERMFTDILARCRPQALSVYARYTRRGGLDINPWRATPGMPAPDRTLRTARQ
jgi:7-cyano-7-deazaguanine reductase